MHSALHFRSLLLSKRLSCVRRRSVQQIRNSSNASVPGRQLRALLIGRQVIKTNKAPTPIASYSQAVKTDSLIFVGGQLGLPPGGKELVSDDPAEQAEQAMKNLGAILEEAGSSYDRVVKTTLLLADIDDFKSVDAVYGKYFSVDPPARAAYAARGLPLNARVEIEAIALTK